MHNIYIYIYVSKNEVGQFFMYFYLSTFRLSVKMLKPERIMAPLR